MYRPADCQESRCTCDFPDRVRRCICAGSRRAAPDRILNTMATPPLMRLATELPQLAGQAGLLGGIGTVAPRLLERVQ